MEKRMKQIEFSTFATQCSTFYAMSCLVICTISCETDYYKGQRIATRS